MAQVERGSNTAAVLTKKTLKEMREKIKCEGGLTLDRLENIVAHMETDRKGFVDGAGFVVAMQTWAPDLLVRDAKQVHYELCCSQADAAGQAHPARQDAWLKIHDFLLMLIPKMSRWRRGMIKRAFKHLDHNSDHRLSITELMSGFTTDNVIKNHPMVTSGNEAESEEIEHLLNFFDGAETMDIALFTDYVEARISLFVPDDDDFGRIVTRLFGVPYLSERGLKRALDMTRERLLSRHKGDVDKMRNALTKAFKFFDKNGDNVIDHDEFLRFLKKMSIWLEPNAIEGLFNHYDLDGDGKITYAEFINAICDKDDEEHKKVAQDNG